MKTKKKKSGKKRISKKQMRRKKLRIFLICFGVLIAAIITAFIVVYNSAYHKLIIECGTMVNASEFIKNGDEKAYFTDASTDIASLMPGEYDISVKSGLFVHKTKVIIEDTISPKAQAVNMYETVGNELPVEAFVTEVSDKTPVTLSFAATPDFKGIGKKNVIVRLTDIAGNITEVAATLDVVPFSKVLTVEAGHSAISINDFKVENADISSNFDFDSVSMNSVADTVIPISYNGDEYKATLSIVDTTAPKATFKDINGFIGYHYKPEDFVVSMHDNSSVSYSYVSDIDVNKTDKQEVTVIITDEGGNTCEGTVTLTLREDTEPPVLEGVHDIEVYCGNSVSYKDGVTVSDNCIEGLDFKVDTTKVDTDTPGIYPVVYTVTDVAGHSVSATCNVIVKERIYDMDEINAAADALLADIIKPDMTEREKCWAIYAYIRGHMYFIDDYDEGEYIKACYDGVIGWKGDCYVYAATAQTLLTRAGIKSILISKIPTRRHHYWNIVNYDGTGWYHFDTTPRAEESKPVFFMWTDSQMMEYSHAHYNCFNYDRSLYPEVVN